MRVLVACEYSGRVRDAFTALGHDATSCDLLPSDKPGKHYQGDVRDILDQGWDLMVAHPECTYLCVTGNKWMKPEFVSRFPRRPQQRQEAIAFFLEMMNAPIPLIAVENPVGIMSSLYRKPDQYIQPYEFGDPHSKKTGLWLKGLPKLVPTKLVEPQMYTFRDGRQDPIWHFESMKLPPLERKAVRNLTFPGIADAMAAQWGAKELDLTGVKV